MAALLEVLSLSLFTVASGAAQFSSGVRLIEVYTTVTDQRGEPVTGLAASDFHVSEDGVAERVTAFAAGEFPLSVVIALDRSFSMAGERLALARQAAAAFVRALGDDDEVMVLTVGSDIEVLTPPMPARAAAGTAWQSIEPWGSTPLYDAIWRAIDAVKTRRGRRALLVISDGADRGSEVRAADLVDHARHADVLLYPVGLGRNRPPVFAELAGVTGGRSLSIADPKQLERSLASLARELRTQYLLGYVPIDVDARRAGWHAIDVRVDRPGVRVRARDGYFVP
jgi:Ca-activated chloride channel family protein